MLGERFLKHSGDLIDLTERFKNKPSKEISDDNGKVLSFPSEILDKAFLKKTRKILREIHDSDKSLFDKISNLSEALSKVIEIVPDEKFVPTFPKIRILAMIIVNHNLQKKFKKINDVISDYIMNVGDISLPSFSKEKRDRFNEKLESLVPEMKEDLKNLINEAISEV